LHKTINTLIGDITSLAVLITQNTKADVFIEYSAHVNKISIKFHPNGWEDKASKPITLDVYLGSQWDKEEDVIKRLQGTKKQLVQFGIKNKLDYSKLPYEIEEVKHYKFGHMEGQK
jgi:hypothetical protein